jgi:hypothetical protein
MTCARLPIITFSMFAITEALISLKEAIANSPLTGMFFQNDRKYPKILNMVEAKEIFVL